MNADELKARQAPLKAAYQQDPACACLTLSASGELAPGEQVEDQPLPPRGAGFPPQRRQERGEEEAEERQRHAGDHPMIVRGGARIGAVDKQAEGATDKAKAKTAQTVENAKDNLEDAGHAAKEKVKNAFDR